MAARGLRRLTRWGLGGAVALSPLAIVIACGETSPAEVAPTTLTTQALAWQEGSTHEKLAWAGKVSLVGPQASSYAPLEYLSGAYDNEAAAANASNWSAKLPTSVAFNAAERHLWVRALPRANESVNPLYMDLTTTSKVQAVPSDVDAEPATSELKAALAQATVSIDAFNNLALNLPPIVTYLPLRFEGQINDGAWFPLSEFGSTAQEFLRLYQTKDPLAIKLRLQLTGTPSSFIFTPPLVKEVDLAPLASYFASGARLLFSGFSAFPNSASHDRLTYVGSVSCGGPGSGYYGPIEYLTGNYPSRAAAEAATAWSTSLPTMTSFQPSERFFWVRALPLASAPSDVKPLYEDITGSGDDETTRLTGIRLVKGNVNAAPTYANIDLGSLSLTGSTPSAITLASQPDLTALPLQLELQINGGDWFNPSALQARITAFAVSYEPTDAISINARQVLVDPLGQYVFTPPPIQPLATSDLQKVLIQFPALDTSALVVNQATSTHNQLNWSGSALVPWLAPTQVKLEYLAAPVTTIAAANAETGWTAARPTITSFLPAQRHLFVRLQLIEGTAVLATTTREVTISSGVQEVKANVNVLAEYINRASLEQLKLVSYRPPSDKVAAPRHLVVTGAPEFTEAPVATEITFSDGKTWIDLTDTAVVDAALAYFVYLRPDLTATPSFQVRLALKKDVTWAVFSPPPALTCAISAALASDLYDAAPTVQVDLSTFMANNWSPFELQDNQGVWPVKGGVAGGWITQAEYDAHKAIWSDAPAKTKLASLSGLLKEAVTGFETMSIRLSEFAGSNSYTPTQIAAIENDPVYQDNNRVFWRWGDFPEDWQWAQSGSIPETWVSMWARVKLAKHKKFVPQQLNAWNVTRTSRLAFASNRTLRGYTMITRSEFDEAIRYLKDNLWPDETRTTDTKLVLFFLNQDKLPATLASDRLFVRLTWGNWLTQSTGKEITKWSEIIEIDFAKFGVNVSNGMLRVEIFATINTGEPSPPGSIPYHPRTFLPPSYFNVYTDTYDYAKGPGHLVLTLDDFKPTS